MCDFEEFIFTCGHSTFRLKSHCHAARNDPNHQCFGVKKLRNIWDQSYSCDRCQGQAQQQGHLYSLPHDGFQGGHSSI